MNSFTLEIITEKRKKYTGFKLDLSDNEILIPRILELKKLPGYFVNEEIEEWRFIGILHKKNEMPQSYLYGPYFNGKSLGEILDLKAPEALENISRLINALNKLNAKGIEYQLRLDSIFFLDDGNILFLPDKITEVMHEIRDEEYRVQNFDLINRPYLTDEKSKITYSIAVLIYRIITGAFPYESKSEEELKNRLRNSRVIPPVFKNPAVKLEISNILDKYFNKKEFNSISISDWQNFIKRWLEEGIFEQIPENEKEFLLNKYAKKIEIFNRSYKKRYFLDKNRNKIVISGFIIILSVFLLSFFLRPLYQPRLTTGFTPEKVVQTFYSSINKLDSVTMDDCIINNAGNNYINEVTTLFVINKQSEAYGIKSHLITADRWFEEGEKTVSPPDYVYGILNLKINSEPDNNQNVFTVSYEKWEPITSNENGILGYMSYRVKDKVYLKKDRNAWVIYKLETLERITNKP